MLSIGSVLIFISSSFAAALFPAGSSIGLLAPSLVVTSQPVCVDSSQQKLWESNDGKPLDPYDCAYALLGVKLSLRKNSKASFVFDSKDDLSITPRGGWKLPYGAASGMPIYVP